MQDRYCAPMEYKGKTISGGAARNVRIMQAGGLEHMIEEVGKQAALMMFNQVMFTQKKKRRRS